MRYQFGPLTQQGGERRLNVAVTRARRRMTVVSSFDAGDMDPERLGTRGFEDAPRLPAVRRERRRRPRRADRREARAQPVRARREGAAGGERRAARTAVRCVGLLDRLRRDASRSARSAGAGDRGRRSELPLAADWPATATGCGRSTSSASAGASTASGRPSGSRNRRGGSRARGAGMAASGAGQRRRHARLHLPPARRPASRKPGPAFPDARPATGRADRAGHQGLPDNELRAMVRWVKSDGRLHTEDDLLAEVMKALGFGRRGKVIVSRIRADRVPSATTDPCPSVSLCPAIEMAGAAGVPCAAWCRGLTAARDGRERRGVAHAGGDGGHGRGDAARVRAAVGGAARRGGVLMAAGVTEPEQVARRVRESRALHRRRAARPWRARCTRRGRSLPPWRRCSAAGGASCARAAVCSRRTAAASSILSNTSIVAILIARRLRVERPPRGARVALPDAAVVRRRARRHDDRARHARRTWPSPGSSRTLGMTPVGLFEVAKLGLPLTLAGLVVIVAPPRGLRPRTGPPRSLGAASREYTVEMVVEPGGPLDGAGVESGGLRSLSGVYLVQIERAGNTVSPVSPRTVLRGRRPPALRRPRRRRGRPARHRRAAVERGRAAGAARRRHGRDLRGRAGPARRP